MTLSDPDHRIVVDTIPAQVWIASPDGGLEFVNQQWIDYTGLSPAQSLGWAWSHTGLIHSDDLSELLATWRRMLETGQPGHAEARVRRFDGEYRWFLARAVPMRDSEGTITRWYGTNTDIEDLKRAEAQLDELKKSEDRLRLVLDTIPVLVTTARPDGSLDFINNRWSNSWDCPSNACRTGGGRASLILTTSDHLSKVGGVRWAPVSHSRERRASRAQTGSIGGC
jgi:PAS domain S-box-containing protein